MGNDNDETYREISFDYTGPDRTSVNFRILASPLLLKAYRANPSRVEDFLTAHFCSAMGDILRGEELDFFIQNINLKAEEKKRSLIKKIHEGEKGNN